jgi:3-methyladenine DNA glycosylase AlkC
VGEFIARRAGQAPERALALHALTQRFTAEFAIRPFIVHHPARCSSTCSAGRRPQRPCAPPGQRRQPAAPALGPAAAGAGGDPSPTLPLLLALQDDPSAYVRRSVANHLNDIAKDHPEQVAPGCTNLPGAGAEPRRALLRHASRTLIKAGDAPVLAGLGRARRCRARRRWQLAPAALAWANRWRWHAELQSTAAHRSAWPSTTRCTTSRPAATQRPRCSRAG